MELVDPDGDVSLAVALQAFALAIGPLPGVDTPQGEPGLILSGTDPIRWILRHWDDLTAEQRATIDSYLRPPAEAAPVGFGGFQAGMRLGAGGAHLAALAADDCPRKEDLLPAVAEIQAAISADLGRTLSAPITACLTDKSGRAAAHAVPFNDQGGYLSGEMAGCRIEVYPEAERFAGAQVVEILAIHVFVCFQADLLTIEPWYRSPSWLLNGSAGWVGLVIAEELRDLGTFPAQPEPLTLAGLRMWLASPRRVLFGRTFEALGFFALMEDTGRNPWSRIDAMLIAGADDGNEAAYLEALGDGPSDTAPFSGFSAPGVGTGLAAQSILNEWGPSHFQNENLGSPWFIPGVEGPLGSGLPVVKVLNGSKVDMRAEPYAAESAFADLEADVVIFDTPGSPRMGYLWEGQASNTVVDLQGLEYSASARLVFAYEPALSREQKVVIPLGRVHLPDGQDLSLDDVSGVAFCTLPGGCSCEAGSPRGGASFQNTSPGRSHIGITGHQTGTDLSVEGVSLDEFCSRMRVGTFERYVLVGGEWDWRANGGVGEDECIYPEAEMSGTFSTDPEEWLLGFPYLEFDTSKEPVEYSGQAILDTEGPTVHVDCPHRTTGFNWSMRPGALWIHALSGDQHTVSDGSLHGEHIRGDDRSEWSLTREA